MYNEIVFHVYCASMMTMTTQTVHWISECSAANSSKRSPMALQVKSGINLRAPEHPMYHADSGNGGTCVATIISVSEAASGLAKTSCSCVAKRCCASIKTL